MIEALSEWPGILGQPALSLIGPLRPDVPPLIKRPDSVVGHYSGNEFSHTCEVVAYPPVTEPVSWSRDDEPILMNAVDEPYVSQLDWTGRVRFETVRVPNDRIIFDPVMPEDRAVYSCVVRNAVGNATGAMFLRVKDRWAVFWPLIGIILEVIVMVVVIFMYEMKRRASKKRESELNGDLDVASKPAGIRYSGGTATDDIAEFISSNAQHARIDELGVENLANEIVNNFAASDYGIHSWMAEELTPSSANDQAVEWIFVTDLLNFSFWNKPSYTVEYRGKQHTGYWALCAAVNRAIEDGVDLLDPKVYGNISASDLRHLFRPTADSFEIPLFEERLRLLHEAGETLLNRFEGKFLNVVQLANHSAVRLLNLLCDYFPSFRDTAHFRGKEVSFLKRAQILVGDLWSCFGGKGVGMFTDIDEITAFADYRIPQVLVYFGVLHYDTELCSLLRNGQLIPNGSEWEVEIRGCSLQAIEMTVRRARAIMAERAQNTKKSPFLCNAILVDNFLWTYRRKHADQIEETMPMHCTRCIFY
ncbi:unnamed protein product [Echinostoma caproni]|uniref:Queuosine 5'-phosphate N-glycosylase/hydrolase n=1 Tax=Echinostoma caproni TaxID=27848 RepID=A0A183A9J1_9TREM|nr:unnamed protein product [Echinostoma caproni]